LKSGNFNNNNNNNNTNNNNENSINNINLITNDINFSISNKSSFFSQDFSSISSISSRMEVKLDNTTTNTTTSDINNNNNNNNNNNEKKLDLEPSKFLSNKSMIGSDLNKE